MEKINMYQLINELKRNPNKLEEKKDYICDNFESLIGSCDSEEIADFLTIISKIPEVHSKIKEKSFEFIDKVYFEKIPAVLKVIQEVNKDLDFSKFSDNELHNKVLSKMTFLSEKTMKEEKVIDFFRELFNEILQKENITMADMEYLGSGTTVERAWRIGAVVFKTGGERNCKEISYSSVLVPSFFREAIYSNTNPSELICFCELQPFVEKIPPRYEYYYRRKILEQLSQERLNYLDWDNMANYGGAIADPTVFERYKIRYIDLAFQGYIGKKDLSNEELARMAQDRYRGFIIDTDDVVEKNNNIYSWY